MYNGCFITGTDTDIGKTFITAALFRSGLLQGQKVAAVKPVQTGVRDLSSKDSAVYRKAIAGLTLTARDFFITEFRCFSMPCSPHLAARLEGEKICIEELLNEIQHIQQDGYFTLLEPAGGLYVPLNDNETNLDLIQQTQIQQTLPVLLVFANKVGCINHVLLSLSELHRRNIPVIGLISNETTPQSQKEEKIIRKDNIAAIEKLSGIPVLAEMPFFEKKDIDTWDTAAKILEPVWERM